MNLRFAPIIRVSTEGQEKKGESLRTQTKQIQQYVHSLGGNIPENCWEYLGQEHATPNQERDKLDKLLEDSKHDLFDAVIVCDASRWSRDNLKNKIGLDVLRKNGIRFFVGTMEYDLYNPEHILFLGMSAELGEFQAKQQALKSIVNKIERSKRGIPCTGKLPYGRTYSSDKGWGIDKEKASKIRNAAERYLNGESIIEIAQTSNMSIANLWTILNYRSGTKWEVKFDSKQLNIQETIEMAIPPLLEDATIEAIKEKAVANRTYTHGEIKNRYLLSRMIFCAKCGLTLFGLTTKKGRRYYRHSIPRYRYKDCSLQKCIPGDLIENSVLIHLIQTFGDIELLRKAVERATPDLEKIGKLADERSGLEQEMKKIANQRERILDMVAEGILTNEEVKEKMGKVREREISIKNRLQSIKFQIDAMPNPEKVKRLSQFGLKVLGNATSKSPQIVFERPYQWKRNLLEHAFGGKDSKGQRLGVYVSETGDPKQPWQIEIRGILETTCIALPLEDEYLENSFHLDPEFQDIEAELEKIKSNITNFSTYPLSGNQAVPRWRKKQQQRHRLWRRRRHPSGKGS